MCQLKPLLGTLLDLKPKSASLPSPVSSFFYYCCQNQVILLNALHKNPLILHFHKNWICSTQQLHACYVNSDLGCHLTLALPDGVKHIQLWKRTVFILWEHCGQWDVCANKNICKSQLCGK